MYSATVQDAYVPEIVDTLERTATPVSALTRLGILPEARTSSADSQILDCLRSTMNVFDALGDATVKLLDTPANWNSYDSPPPTAVAVKNAQNVLAALRAKLVAPERVLPSAEGGVSLIFVSDTISRAAIENFNGGESFVLLYDLNGRSDLVEWPATAEEQLHVVERIATHLRSNGLAA
jgi:hypothetical protein